MSSVLGRAKKAAVGIIAGACVALLGWGVMLPLKAEAANLGWAIFGAVMQYSYLDQQIKYLDNEGRDKYFVKLKEEYGVNQDPQLNQSLDSIMQRLSSSIATIDPSIKEKPYNYFINNQTTFNAFCTLGHNVSVNTGLFKLLDHHEDKIAFIVAHELAHGQKNHPVEGFRKSLPITALAQLQNSQNNGAASDLLVSTLAKHATASGVTKPQEWEADHLAFDYAVSAGYNPGAGAAVWQRVIEKMGKDSGNFVGEIFSPSDHPKHEERRDNYAKKMSAFSRDHVTVADGLVKVNGKAFLKPADASEMSGKERCYLIAGNLAAVYHNSEVIPAAYVKDGIVMLGNQPIILPLAGEPSAQSLADLLNTLKQ